MEAWKKRFWTFGFPPLLWMVVIFCLSSVPGKHIPKIYLLHQAAHLIEYSVFGVLLARALAHLEIKLNVWTLSLLSVLLIAFFAIFDEWRQSFVPGRTGNLSTVFFDTAYAILGVALYDEIVFVLWKKKARGTPDSQG